LIFLIINFFKFREYEFLIFRKIILLIKVEIVNKQVILLVFVLALMLMPVAIDGVDAIVIRPIPMPNTPNTWSSTLISPLDGDGGDSFDDPWHPA
jgi:hypothetical protein